MHPAQLPIEELLAECEVKRTRGSGPGGQHRNKVETAVVITHLPTGISGEASERRSQEQNRTQAILRLRLKLALATRSEPSSGPSQLWQSRAAGKRISVSPTHADFPAMLAEVLDCLAQKSFAVAEVAAFLGVTTSQLVKFLKIEPAALAAVNREREKLGEPRLR